MKTLFLVFYEHKIGAKLDENWFWNVKENDLSEKESWNKKKKK